MSLHLFGRSALRLRFIELLRGCLGDRLGPNLILAGSDGTQVAFRQYASDFRGVTDVQRHFFTFLNRIVRDSLRRVEIDLVENDRSIQFGTWYERRQTLDVADIEAIPDGNAAFTRSGVITHEIAERWWLVGSNYRFNPRVVIEDGRAVADSAQAVADFILYFGPAHTYALQQEEEVTGWRQIGYSQRDLIPAPIRRDRLRHPYWFVLRSHCGVPMEEEYRFEPRGAGRSFPGGRQTRRRVVITRGRCLLPEIQVQEMVVQVPVNARSPRPTGH